MRITALLLLAAVSSFTAQAEDIDRLDLLNQEQFRILTGDLTSALAYRGMQPAEPYGVVGFDIGLEFSGVSVENDAVWQLASGEDVSTLPVARLSVNKGLPLGIDVGAFIAQAPGSNVELYGAQLRYAIFEGGVATPALGLRAAYTRLQGVEQLNAETRSLDLSLSKGFGPVTPYVGYGHIWADFSPGEGIALADEEHDEDRMFAGVRFSLLALQLTLEGDRTGDTTAYSLKLGFGF